MRSPALLYTRDLPGGGFVVIEATQVSDASDPAYRAALCVERRADPSRRAGHRPPVVAEVEGVSPAEILAALYPIAADNVAVAQQILLWQARRQPAT
jgi:hypothetical protein